VLTAAEAISNSPSSPRLRTISFNINSPMGLRQMLPWHKNRIFVMIFTPLYVFRTLHDRLFAPGMPGENIGTKLQVSVTAHRCTPPWCQIGVRVILAYGSERFHRIPVFNTYFLVIYLCIYKNSFKNS